jgi:hypothetical protein
VGRPLESVFVDVGENGLFARDEFETLTALGSMEFVTPEEIADYVLLELQGRPTGRDVVAALDAATAGPTYQAGMLRAFAVERLKQLEAQHGVRPVAFEMLGPPRLSKNLFEAFLWSRLRGSVRALAESRPADLAEAAAHLVRGDADLRSQILTVGLPILVAGDRVSRGATVIVPPTDGDVDAAAARGWVDLRPASCATWIRRATRVVEQEAARGGAHGSGSDEPWGAMAATDPIEPARFATWIFKYEDEGERIKR